MDTVKLAKELGDLKADETLYIVKNGAFLVENGGSYHYVTETGKENPPRVDGPLTVDELILLLNQYPELD